MLVLSVAGAAALTGAETKATRGFCIDGPAGGNCVTEQFVRWDGPLLLAGSSYSRSRSGWCGARSAGW